ncbi:MAG: glycosyltransferase [Pseudobutyrivibrio sp.]|nr:glycosyltransferase [Pseudobutyrivibrio sp.]
MKYLFINSVAGYGSTGHIIENTARGLMQDGHQCAIAYGRHLVNCDGITLYRIGSKLDVALHGAKTRLFDAEGFGSKAATRKLVKWIDTYQPDVIWLHNLHGYYINVEVLFGYLKSHPDIQVKWTLHDCWTMTGHCAHFMTIDCNQWMDGCTSCQLLGDYPKCIGLSNVSKNYARKKAAFTGVKNIEIIVPCKWMGSVVEQSYLREYPARVVYNTIDLQQFRPIEIDTEEKICPEKKIILGVASVWNHKKGLDDFIKLDTMIDHDRYQIVLVGLNKQQLSALPASITGLERTNSTLELAKLYTEAFVYLNLTYEDNYPTTNLEAQACGTPCITYNTGGSPESVPADNVIEKGDLKSVITRIEELFTCATK